jgi:hypothetical protein
VDQVLITTNPPLFILQPISQVLPMGTNTSLAVSAVGASPISFQWLKDGTNIPGAVSSTYSIFNATRSDGGNYTAIASNPGGGVLSSNATIIVQVPQRLSTPIRLPNGQFSVLSGDADGGQLSPADLADFEAQVSTNLTSWTTLSNSLTLTNGMLLLTDPGSTNKPIRFYRIIEH